MHVPTFILTAVAYFVFSAAAGAMAEPTEQQKRSFYGWFYRFIQRLAANADRVAEARFGNLADHSGFTGRGIVASSVTERTDIAVDNTK